VAHAFDDLTAAREYHVPLSPDSALMAIARQAGERYCPMAVNALLAAGLDGLDVLWDGRHAAEPETRATDGEALADSPPVPVDYRLVTTS
jgi:HD-GYP domain-containing protein (c-di-GMP phosphodiesterase class II)